MKRKIPIGTLVEIRYWVDIDQPPRKLLGLLLEHIDDQNLLVYTRGKTITVPASKCQPKSRFYRRIER